MNEWKATSQSLSDLPEVAESLLAFAGDVRAIAFYGDLGAGKTTLIKAICHVLGVQEAVTSPTFGLIHEYKGAEAPVIHADLYRIRREEELEVLGWDEYLDDPQAWLLIEWPERAGDQLPLPRVELALELVANGQRQLIAKYLSKEDFSH